MYNSKNNVNLILIKLVEKYRKIPNVMGVFLLILSYIYYSNDRSQKINIFVKSMYSLFSSESNTPSKKKIFFRVDYS